jgi:hypothetical protein
MDYTLLSVTGTGGPSTDPLCRRIAAGGAGASGADPAADGLKRILVTPECRVLQQYKNQINDVYTEGKWDDYKKITNPYEYIFLSWNRRSSRSVATRQPLSRSYFKMIELWKYVGIDAAVRELVERDGALHTAHAAEGPGGFIEACAVMASRNDWGFGSATGITLQSDAKNIPGWRKTARFLTAYPQVTTHNGADGTGDILKTENMDAFVRDFRETHPNGAHVFTADGGFDFSGDYGAQEDAILPLLLAETLIGLRTLSKGGVFILKCFDTTLAATIDLLWLIRCSFCEWSLVKPRTSRAGNAERYIVGKGFLGDVEDVVSILTDYMRTGDFTARILQSPPHSPRFLQSLLTLQTQIEHLEIQVIYETLQLIRSCDSAAIRRHVRANVQRSVAWCEEHEEEINAGWVYDIDKNIARETSDLIHILQPAAPFRSTSAAMLPVSFEGFRSECAAVVVPPFTNPFSRIKK